jgi:signal peptidase I
MIMGPKSMSRLKFIPIVFIFLAAFFLAFTLPNSGLATHLVKVSGTGSMFPTFPKGTGTESAELASQIVASPAMHPYPGKITLFGHDLYSYQIKRGDIISFYNSKTKEISQRESQVDAGFVKRVIAIPKDVVEIRDGFVWINGVRQLENYIASPRSTFGGEFLSDCHRLTIPSGFYFVMGDNRKSSNDSRHEIGLISDSDIDAVLPYTQQQLYAHLWRDASFDDQLADLPFLNSQDYLKLLNQKRSANQLPPLKYHKKLEQSARRRAENILTYNDLSFEATKSGYTMAKAMGDVGYSNIIWGEAPTMGFYTAEELVDNYFQFPESKKFLLQKDFQETGIAVVMGKINNCPVQIVVQHLAGYVPPNYDPKIVASWKNVLTNLKSVRPGWDIAQKYPEAYAAKKSDFDQILKLFDLRISRIEVVVVKMQNNLWLSDTENAWVKEDASLGKQLQSLITKVN